MARPLRIEYAGALYHVTARVNARANIYTNDDDSQLYLSLLKIAVDRYDWYCQAYCLMDNHYHLLIETNPSKLV
ncbi:transposase [Undibacterium sp. Di24W]|uniref:transposase n=1 Tax=Undibacterium sp. Di24W TaxID=3413033 RepID=UPI003BF2CAAD